MPGIGSFTGIVNRDRRLRPGDEAGDPRRVRHVGQPLRPRRDDSRTRQSFCEIDPDVKDRWGIPVLRFHWEWSDHELEPGAPHAATFRAILEAMGGQIDTPGRPAASTAESRRRRTRAAQPGQRDAPAPRTRRRRGRPSRAAARSSTRSARPHGQRPADQRAQQVLPGARRQEPVRRRRGAVRRQCRQESRRTRSSRSRGARPSISPKK